MLAILNLRGPVADSAEHATVLLASILSAGEEEEESNQTMDTPQQSERGEGERVRFGSEWDGNKSSSTHKERNPSKKSK